MTNDDLIRLVINGVVISWTAVAALNILAASVYDAGQYRVKRLLRQWPDDKRLQARPLISIIVPFQNDQSVILPCLESILKNNYPKYEVILTNASSQDATADKVREFIAAKSKKTLSLIDNGDIQNLQGAVQLAAQAAGGDLIMVLSPRCRLEDSALLSAVLRLNLTAADSVGLNVKVRPENKLLGLYEQYEYMVRYQARKINSLLHQSRGFENAVIYQRQALSTVQGNKIRYHYAADAVAYRQPSASFAEAVRRQKRRPAEAGGIWQIGARVYLSAMRILAPFLFIFFIYEAVFFRQTFLFGLAWISLIIFLSLSALADERATLKSKLALIVLSPMMYGPFFLTSLISPVTAIRNLVYSLYKRFASKLRLPRFFSGTKKEKIA
jgi:glycosyltransferase involved in cell wall biosynthesis